MNSFTVIPSNSLRQRQRKILKKFIYPSDYSLEIFFYLLTIFWHYCYANSMSLESFEWLTVLKFLSPWEAFEIRSESYLLLGLYV